MSSKEMRRCVLLGIYAPNRAIPYISLRRQHGDGPPSDRLLNVRLHATAKQSVDLLKFTFSDRDYQRHDLRTVCLECEEPCC